MDKPYGMGDASFQAAGGEAGIHALVTEFYRLMDVDPRFVRLNRMHQMDKAQAADRLARFLCGWLGGPRRYREKYGAINIPGAHGHLDVTTVEHDEWLACMREAAKSQPFADEFKDYLLRQLAVPAGVILARSEAAAKLG